MFAARRFEYFCCETQQIAGKQRRRQPFSVSFFFCWGKKLKIEPYSYNSCSAHLLHACLKRDMVVSDRRRKTNLSRNFYCFKMQSLEKLSHKFLGERETTIPKENF
jgi:hypothetical protein